MSAAGRRNSTEHDQGLDMTDGRVRQRTHTGHKKTFWSSLKGKSHRSSTTSDLHSRSKKTLSAQLSSGSSPAATYEHENPLGLVRDGEEQDSVHDDQDGTPRRSRSFREKTSNMFSRVARRVSRRRTHGRLSRSPSRSSTPASRPSSRGASSPAALTLCESPSSSGLPAKEERRVASRGEVTAAEYTDNSNQVVRPGIEVTDASIADISAAVQQLTERTSDPFSSTPSSSPLPRRRANTTDPASNKHLATLLAPKKWLSRNRLLCEWSPCDEEPAWCSPEGEVVNLAERTVLQLSVVENRALRKHLHKSLESDLGLSFPIPKDPEDQQRGGLNSVLRPGKHGAGNEKGPSPSENCVFGIPLERVLENDRCIARRKLEYTGMSAHGLSRASSANSLDETSSDHQSISDVEDAEEADCTDGNMNTTGNSMEFNGVCQDPYLISDEAASVSALDLDEVPHDLRMTRTFSLSEAVSDPVEPVVRDPLPAKASAGFEQSDSMPFSASAGILGLAAAPLHFLGRSADNLLKGEQPAVVARAGDGTTLSQLMRQQRRAQARLASHAELEIRVRDHKREVPEFLRRAFEFLKDYGMQTVGIFRLAGSKRRCRQIREEMDNGFEISFLEGAHQPCDVAALVKNFLRDLPEPLLTRTLFPAFVAASKIEDSGHQTAVLRDLIGMLPVSNRDTLHELLCFLRDVADFSEDRTVDGELVPGHKMDAANLAVVFGPNIMRPYKNKSGSEFKVSKQDQASNQDYIQVVIAQLIRGNTDLFKVPTALQHEILLTIRNKAPLLLEALLQRRLGKSPMMRRAVKTPSTSSSSELPASPASNGVTGTGSGGGGGGGVSKSSLQVEIRSTSHLQPLPLVTPTTSVTNRGLGNGGAHEPLALVTPTRSVTNRGGLTGANSSSTTNDDELQPLITPMASVINRRLGSGSGDDQPRPPLQHRLSKPIGPDDFAELNPQNGELVPSFALPGSPLESLQFSTSPMDILSITVHDIADRTPPMYKRRLPAAVATSPPHGRSMSVSARQLSPPPESALFGSWQNRWPSGDDVRSPSTSPEKKSAGGSGGSGDIVRRRRREANDRSKSTLKDESSSSRDNLSPLSGDQTPLAGMSHSDIYYHHAESTPIASATERRHAFDPPLAASSAPSRSRNLYLAPDAVAAAENDAESTTPVNGSLPGAPGARRFPPKQRRHKPLDRRYTEPAAGAPALRRETSDAAAPPPERKPPKQFQQLRQFFESFHLGSNVPQAAEDGSPATPCTPEVLAPENGSSLVDGTGTNGVSEPGNQSTSFWMRFKSENPETLV